MTALIGQFQCQVRIWGETPGRQLKVMLWRYKHKQVRYKSHTIYLSMAAAKG